MPRVKREKPNKRVAHAIDPKVSTFPHNGQLGGATVCRINWFYNNRSVPPRFASSTREVTCLNCLAAMHALGSPP
jgi:hypothetical protein